jgi:hypothetical protein
MRVSLSLALLLSASSLWPAVLAENGLLVIGDKGADAIRGGPPPQCRFQWRFKLDAPTKVWAEAEGLQGLQRGGNAAPELFLGESYLGPLRLEHGDSWRSPKAVLLPAGEHALELRCAAVRDADDVSIQRLRVLSDAPAPSRPGPRRKPASAAACRDLRTRKDWPARLGRGSVTLSVLSGRQAGSGILVQLEPGQAWHCAVRVPQAPGGGALALAAQWERLGPQRWRLLFFIDPQGRANPRNDAVGYEPGAWEPLHLQLCEGRLQAAFAKTGALPQAVPQGPIQVEIAAQDLELGLKPAL